MVVLVVGPDSHRITAHRTLLAYYSIFFNAAFYGIWKTTLPEYRLPDNDPVSVQAFVTCTYTGHYSSHMLYSVIKSSKSQITQSDDIAREMLMVKAWVTGDMLLAPKVL